MVLAPSKPSFQFVAYGDIRFTQPSRLTEREVSNSYARDAIVDAIANSQPAFVVISGDLVWRGASASDWLRFDRETKPLSDRHVPILPVVGNHEYLSSDFVGSGREQGLLNYYRRFPDIPNRMARPWYSARYSNCYFLMMDSNDNDSPDSEQMKWAKAQLNSLPPSIEFVFIILHRPPYTAATDGEHRPRIAEVELAKFLESRQEREAAPKIIVIAGHVHNYERFEKNGVVYLVSGGGGAHPHPLNRRSDDKFHPKSAREIEFHYCVLSISPGQLKFQMMRLASTAGPPKFEMADSFELSVKQPVAQAR